jgi:hypothetical protein
MIILVYRLAPKINSNREVW